MHLADGFDGVEPVELEWPSVEAFAEIVVAGEVLLLDLKICWFAAPIVHVVGVVNGVAHVQAMLRVIGVAFADMELSGFLELIVLGVGIDSFPLEVLPDDFALDESFCPSEILEGAHYF